MGTTSSIKKSKYFGLIGETLSYSFSKSYFVEKFKTLNLENHFYENFEFENESDLAHFLLDEVSKLQGFNVTIPYKEIIIPYLDKLDSSAETIQAVNTVLIKNNELIGYNTDIYGFLESIKPKLKRHHNKALILGTGGASKAVKEALTSIGIQVKLVSRNPKSNAIIAYQDLNESLFDSHQIIVNTTPIGTFPEVAICPDIPYQYLTNKHLVFDLVYNPKETLFLNNAKKQGASIQNGLQMLQNQAEKAWKIWTL